MKENSRMIPVSLATVLGALYSQWECTVKSHNFLKNSYILCIAN